MFSFKNIYHCYLACRKHKRNSANQLAFECDLIANLWQLKYDLDDKSYSIGKSICFLTASPKLREVFASSFRDRVVHHILVRELEKYYEPKFIHDVYSNRKGKGIHQATKRSQRFMHCIGDEGYYLQLDIKGFFYTIDKNILFMKIFNDLSNNNPKKSDNIKDILWLSNKIIYHNYTKNYHFQGDKSNLARLPTHKTLFKIPKSKGLPIGNLTSQFFANIYMSDFDNWIKRQLKVKYYLRYVDDFVLFHKDENTLKYYKKEIEKYLETLGLSLREDSKLQRFRQGLDFLGYIIRPNYLLVRKRVVNNYKIKKARYLNEYERQKGNMSLEEIKAFLPVQASFVGHIKHANSYNLKQKIGELNDEKTINLMFTHWRSQC